MNVLSFNCPCGNTDPEKTRYHDGYLGYEAIICLKCGAYHDFTGIHYYEVKPING
jgi:hypothetical protein